MAINEERVQLLVDDLLSDEHEQATGFLCKRGLVTRTLSFCCLGRATEVAIKHGLKITTAENEVSGVVRYIGSEHSEISVMLTEVAEWYGFPCNNPALLYQDVIVSLAELNDGENSIPVQLSLPEIGELIRDTYLTPDGDSA